MWAGEPHNIGAVCNELESQELAFYITDVRQLGQNASAVEVSKGEVLHSTDVQGHTHVQLASILSIDHGPEVRTKITFNAKSSGKVHA